MAYWATPSGFLFLVVPSTNTLAVPPFVHNNIISFHILRSLYSQGSRSHGKSRKMSRKVIEIKNILKSLGISLLLITNHTRSSDNSISTGLLQWFGFGRLVYVLVSQFVMLGGRQTIFLTPYFHFEEIWLYFYVCDEYV